MLQTTIKIKTRNVDRSADCWGYTLRINGKFLMMDFDGYNSASVRFADTIERAAVFTSITTLRQYWAKYMPFIIALSNS